jgi:Domain of unknown function (DUF5666)
MIGAPTQRASAARQTWLRRWTLAPAGLAVIALAATACGSGSPAASAPPASNSPAANASPSPTTQATFPGVIGTAAAVSGSSMQVQNPTSGEVTVTFTSTTPIIETVAATAKDITVGSCVTVLGQPSTSGSASGPVTATTVTISAPVKGSCTGAGGFGGFGGFGGRSGFPRGTFSPRPGESFSPRPRPSGSRGAFGGFGGFGGANGKVTSMSASGFVVQSRSFRSGASSPATTDVNVAVITNATTKYLKTVTAHPSALKVGQCITAIGSANSIGAIAARSIRVSQPGPNGCTTGFGRGGNFPGGPGRPSANA